MNFILERLTGLNDMTDQVIAMDFLITAKSGVRNYAMAVTECATPEIKAVLAKQLEEAIDTYEKIADYAIRHNLYHPYDLQAQINLDLQNMQTAQSIPT
ncbi:spore coat protein [Paenibacillus thermotolerans]|uniref:spore coat protein n=1 Tax=Paenibacillus thermotolerans TaxID=3027807 RepID=UPI0023687E74|nr:MULTISPECIES: spore coat protein [unclassified Paenibacillus]